ncbi:MAG: hypothetical protein IPQ00_10660 [Chloracidobacterium sp.]|nr:hypothetical protein [Chloracidobacterium sp.]
MIAGFNTDIEFDGVVYHVQTEDKGLPSRKIISLVYDGGTILASKRTNYEDLPTGALDETAVAERVQKQHTLICAAIRAGRLEDLKAMTAKASAARSADPAPIHHEAAISADADRPCRNSTYNHHFAVRMIRSCRPSTIRSNYLMPLSPRILRSMNSLTHRYLKISR